MLVAAVLALLAGLYSSVGHGGASGYLAVLAIAGFAREELRPIALCLNVIVASVATWQFRAYLNWRLLWPFVAASMPLAFVGGKWIHLEAAWYSASLGVVLIYAAWRLLDIGTGVRKQCRVPDTEREEERSGFRNRHSVLVPRYCAVLAGSIIGLISGTIGVGGGIFLSPLIILLGWAAPKPTAAVSAAFILLNSITALFGLVLHHQGLPVEPGIIALFGSSVLVAGFLGSTLGALRMDAKVLKRVLAIVLIIAAIKMILNAIPITPMADRNEDSSTLERSRAASPATPD